MSAEALILCDNLVKIYRVGDHDVVALQGLDLMVQQGELLGIVGVSGSGKSTLMNVLGGLDRPSAGRVRVAGNDLLKLPDAALDRYRLLTVGFVWQQSSRNLVPYLNALDNVELPMILGGQTGRSRRARADELLQAVGLAERRHHRLSELSGGEQQRVAIAVALANGPSLLLADEPTGEVDETTAQMIYDIFRGLNHDLGLTILIVSHDQNLAHHVDRVVAIRDGKIASEVVRALVPPDGPAPLQPDGSAHVPGGEAHHFTELTVLDSAGRLQVPKEYRERFNIRRRVQLEPTEEGILIRPVAEVQTEEKAEALIDQIDEARDERGWRKLLRKAQSLTRVGGRHGSRS